MGALVFPNEDAVVSSNLNRQSKHPLTDVLLRFEVNPYPDAPSAYAVVMTREILKLVEATGCCDLSFPLI